MPTISKPTKIIGIETNISESFLRALGIEDDVTFNIAFIPNPEAVGSYEDPEYLLTRQTEEGEISIRIPAMFVIDVFWEDGTRLIGKDGVYP